MSNTAIFLDRDGTLIHDPGYLNHPDQVQLIEGAAQALKEFQLLGYQRVVATNQSAVARGIVTAEMLERIHDRLRELLAAQGASLDAIYYCPYHPEGTIAEYRQDSDWRKPQPGMLLAAAREMDLDLSRSWMIGDNDRDVEAGRSAGCTTILIGAARQGAAKPDYVAVNMREAVNIVKRYRHTLGDGRISPMSEASQISNEQSLTAKIAEIVAMPQERASQKPESSPGNAPLLSGMERKTNQEIGGPGTTAGHSQTEQLLAAILEQLRRTQKREMFGDFSFMRLLAGVVQVFVPVCLLLAAWFLAGPQRQDNNVLLALGFAMVLQVMALTFYLMQGRR